MMGHARVSNQHLGKRSFRADDDEEDVDGDFGILEELHENEGFDALMSSSIVCAGDAEVCRPKQPPRDPLLQLVSLQNASGSWKLDPALAAALGKTQEEVENTKPSGVNQDVWATTLALIWLHGYEKDAQDEWELLAMKAVSWLRAQNAPYGTECLKAGNALLGFNVQKDALGL
ncbi:von Willebrand factor A domain-containing protein 5A-like isoform X1 [Plectropomus leopardus]|nr:von Willebrand factor A domain-containing protein 5A-like isoform X1 [Plectropomus leopardus]